MKLIDKDALVAEIEKRKHMCDFHHGEYWDGCYNTMEDLISFLNTLEVKAVDLDAEIIKWEESFWHCPASMGYKETAKHFFELGISVSNKAQKG